MFQDKSENNLSTLLNKGRERLKSRDYSQALTISKTVISKFPRKPEAWYFASQVTHSLKDFSKTLKYLDKALLLKPKQPNFLLFKANTLLSTNKVHKANDICKMLRKKPIDSLHFKNELASLLVRLKQYKPALVLYQNLVQLKPDFAGFHYNVATTYRMIGDIEKAEAAISKAITLNPSDYEALQLRSSLKKQNKDQNHITELQKCLNLCNNNLVGKMHISYALAKELEDIGETKSSFQYLNSGADIRRSMLKYKVTEDINIIKQLEKSYTTEILNSKSKRSGCKNKQAIFILGLPRTGSTLIDSIISSHDQVVSAGELHHLNQQVIHSVHNDQPYRAKNGTEFIKLSTGIDFTQLGINYISSTSEWVDENKMFIDKQPQNSLNIGFIHLSLPSAKIIHVKRHPLDTCFAIYKNLFANAYHWSYNLDELADYYIAHHQLMTHWHKSLPEKIHIVNYEHLINDLEGQTKQMLEFCQLDWQEQCIEFHKHAAPSATASASQIRSPVYKSSIGLWKNYSTELTPLKNKLEKAGIDCSM